MSPGRVAVNVTLSPCKARHRAMCAIPWLSATTVPISRVSCVTLTRAPGVQYAVIASLPASSVSATFSVSVVGRPRNGTIEGSPSRLYTSQ